MGTNPEMLSHRERIYEAARRRRPDRWSRTTRNWEPILEVTLNAEPREREIPK